MDPLVLQLARVPSTLAPAAGGRRQLPPAVESAVNQLVRRIAWGGDGRRAGARIEVGAGRYSGSAVELLFEDGVVRVTALGDAELGERVAARLAARGLGVEIT